MSLSITSLTKIANLAIKYYVKGPAWSSTIQNKPLLRILEKNKKYFSGGYLTVSEAVQGAWMNDTAPDIDGASHGSFFHGYEEDDQLAFTTSDNTERAEFTWKEHHAGLVTLWTSLKRNGFSIDTESNKPQKVSDSERVRLTSIVEENMADFAESYHIEFNNTCWKDGSQDSKVFDGLLSILTDTPAAGNCGGLSRSTNTWWRHRLTLNIGYSVTDQTLTKFLRAEAVQLRRRRGNPTVALCGSAFLEALRNEVAEKGYYTQNGFNQTNDVTVGPIKLEGTTFEYDPTLDDIGYAKRCYWFDPKKICLRPMRGEENKLANPERPYDYALMLKSMFWTGTMTCKQLNCNGVYSIA